MGLFSCEENIIDKLKIISNKSLVQSFGEKLFKTAEKIYAHIFAQGAGLTTNVKIFSDNATTQTLENNLKIDDVEFSASTRQHLKLNITDFLKNIQECVKKSRECQKNFLEELSTVAEKLSKQNKVTVTFGGGIFDIRVKGNVMSLLLKLMLGKTFKVKFQVDLKIRDYSLMIGVSGNTTLDKLKG